MTVTVGFASLTCQRYPGDPRGDAELVAEALALAEEAERLGFHCVWTSEHHFFDDSYSSAVLVLSAAIAARTRRIEIGTGIALAPLYEPVRLAEDAAAVDLVSGGRFLLGIAPGWREEEFEGLRVPYEERGRRFEDTVATLRQAWSEGLATGGAIVRYPGVSVTPKPARPGGPPILVGATVARTIRRAARLGDGFIASWSTLPSFSEHAWVRDELARSDRDPGCFRLAVVNPTFAWPDEKVWERVRQHLWYYAWKFENMAAARGRLGAAPAPPPLPAVRERELRELCAFGTPEQVAERIRSFAEAAGGELHWSAELAWPGLDPSLLREAMAVFAEEVVPLLR
jgi:alkanesulfonate monooxygenase SsuD/methylene tetrahydromethanopterin reductase-like flavin-dependent oxidoreductase (luciferase family)